MQVRLMSTMDLLTRTLTTAKTVNDFAGVLAQAANVRRTSLWTR